MLLYIIAIYTVCGAYMLLNFKYDIQMLQQNSYRIRRYYKWLENGNFFSAWRLVDVAMLFMLFSTLINGAASALIISIVSLVKICLILKKKYKKPLVFTNRVKRIYALTGSIAAAALIVSAFLSDSLYGTFEYLISIPLGVLLLITTFSWSIVIAGVWLLTPVEKAINKKYYNEARAILESMPDLKVIGITGSYGKTSTKHYLNRILSESYDVIMTPGSYNTPMGVIRTVRELMKPYNQIFICEMGAKQKGDIKEICDLVHPQTGIITAVGPMHLETFKTIEMVQSTKFELADAIPADGLIVINNDFEACASRKVSNTKAFRYSVASPEIIADYRATDVNYSPDGTSFTIEGPSGFSIQLTTKLVGECNIANLLGAIVIALYYGVPEDRIRYAVASIEQVEHRLNIKQTPGGVTIIDDAFNSNPAGSKMAVDVLSHFKDGKRIIVTPGMIELGEQQFELNQNLGKYIGENVDIAVIVGGYNREALVNGIKSTGFPDKNLHIVDSFAESQVLLSSILRKGDTVLYENDLPDTFK